MTDATARVGDAGDVGLMLRVQANEPDAFGELYDRFGVGAYGVAFGVAGDPARAEDIVQEAFLSVWRNRARFRPERGSVGGWVMGIVRNRAIDSLLHHSRHDSRRAGADGIEERFWASGDLQETITERDQAARLRDTLARLPTGQRDVITLAYFGELTTSEIAKELSLPLGTVKGRMRLGLNKLRENTTR